MAQRFDDLAVFLEAQQVMAALSADMLMTMDPAQLLLRAELSKQQDVTLAAYLILKSVIIDFCGEDYKRYLASLGMRVTQRAEHELSKERE